jgi:hypothetical protein
MNQDIQTAIDAIKANHPTRQLYADYYDGRHQMAFATEKFKTAFGRTLERMRDNLCPIIVDAVADRLEVINFSGNEEGTDTATPAWELWQRERMEIVSNETHIEALKTGAAYLIVWSDRDNNARFYLQDSRNCVIIEDEDTSDPLFGAKQWKTADDFIRLNLYYDNRIERYITQKKRKGEVTGDIKADHFIPLTRRNQDGETTETAVTPNPFGVLPMFRFETNPCLADAIPVQDALNKTLMDMMVAMEFAAFRQRWATGLTPPSDEYNLVKEAPFKAGVDRLWFTDSENVKFGEFDATDLEKFLKVSDSFRLEMARVSGTPLHFFSINTSDAISGEALKTLESRFNKKALRLQINFGAVWANAMKLALRIERASAPDNLTTQWTEPEQRSEKEMLEAALLKQELGVPANVLLEEIGYTAEDIAKFDAMTEADEPEDPDPAVRMAREQMNGR